MKKRQTLVSRKVDSKNWPGNRSVIKPATKIRFKNIWFMIKLLTVLIVENLPSIRTPKVNANFMLSGSKLMFCKTFVLEIAPDPNAIAVRMPCPTKVTITFVLSICGGVKYSPTLITGRFDSSG